VADAAAARACAAAARAAMRAQVGTRGWFALRTLTAGFTQLAEVAGFVLLVDRFTSLAGWTGPEVALLFGLGTAGQGLGQALAKPLDAGEFAETVRRGHFDQVLLRPVGPLPWLLASALDLRYLGRVLTGLAVLAWAAGRAGVAWTGPHLALAALSITCCAAILASVFVLGAALTLRTVEGTELLNVVTFGGVFLTSFPMEIYGPVLRFVFTWVLPFALAVYVPALALLGRAGTAGPPRALLLAPVATVALAAAAGLGWRAGVRRYLGTGS